MPEDAPPSPHPASENGDTEQAALPTERSAVEFGSEIVGRLNQEAFYADDTTFIDPHVYAENYHDVLSELNLRVDDPRWAIATFPGATKRTWFVASPLTVNVVAFDAVAGTATLDVWIVTVFSREDLGAVESRFYTETAEIRWVEDRWMIAGLDSAPGPSASLALDASPTTPADLADLLDGHLLISGTVPTVEGS